MKRRFKSCEIDGIVEIQDDGKCPACGAIISKPIDRKVMDVMSFRPHYSMALGTHVNSEADMQRAAERIGHEKYGYPIRMKRA